MDGCARSTEGTSVATCVPFFFHLLNYSLNMPGVFLVGFMGAGKTSVGRRLSQRLGWRFEDLDDRIVAREGIVRRGWRRRDSPDAHRHQPDDQCPLDPFPSAPLHGECPKTPTICFMGIPSWCARRMAP